MCRHSLRAMSHLLTNDGGIQTRQFPPLVTTATEGMQSAFGQTECPQSRVQAIMQNIRFENWSVAPGTEDKFVRVWLRIFFQEFPQQSHGLFSFRVMHHDGAISGHVLALANFP